MIDSLFLSVGAMKAGTTWLHQQLAGHPQIHFCPEKEIHYFADPNGQSYMSLAGRVSRYQQVVRNLTPERINPHVQRNLIWYGSTYLAPTVDDDWYAGLFELRPPTKKAARYMADFSNLYATLDAEGWDHVRRVARSVRVLYTVRHPAKRLWSHLKFSYEFSGRGAELPYLTDVDFKAFLDNPNNIMHADYARAVDRLRDVLSPDEVRFYFFEDFRSSPIETLRSIEQFLAVDPQPYREDKLQARINPSRELTVPAVFADAAERLRVEQIAALTDRGFTVPDAWHTPMQ